MKRLQNTLLAACFALLAAAPAAAWQWAYGPPNSIDDAFRRVHPVPGCGPFGAGYIAVGTQDDGFGDPDVYVVHTDLLGNSLPRWETTFDVQANGLQDEGMAIVSIPPPNPGYVVLSNSFNGVWRPALTFLNCFGQVQWSRIYFDVLNPNPLDVRGNDLIRTQTGNPNFNTFPGDLVVVGRWFNGVDDDGFVMRTNAAGFPSWNIAHNTGVPEEFNAVAEALPVGAEPAGDLVAVGRYTTPLNDQALVARVSGNNGTIGAAPQCFQHHGANVAGSDEVYNSVVRLANFAPGQFAFVGTATSTNAGGWQEDIWVTRGNTCGLNAQSRYGNPGAITSEHGHDIVEVLVAKPGTPAGSLAIAGDHGPVGGPYDAALMLLTPAFAPIAGQQFLYGDFGPFDETFFSLAEDPAGWGIGPGYILAGLTQAPWNPGDPQDMYLVHDDPAGFACEMPWNPARVITNWPQVDLASQPRRPIRTVQVGTPQIFQSNGTLICP